MRILRVYERYFGRLVYGVFAFILFAVLSLFVFFDMLNELENVNAQYTSLVALLHVLLQAPTRVYEVLPIAVLISAIYVFSQLASQSEFTIFRVAGLNTRQALFSLFKLAVPLAIVTFLFGEFIGPRAEQYAQKIKLEAIGATVSAGFRSGVWVKDRDQDPAVGGEITRFVNVAGLRPDQTITGITIYEFDPQYRLRVIRVAQEGRYQGGQSWELQGVSETRFSELAPQADPAQPAPPRDALAPDFRAEQLKFPRVAMHSELTPQILSVLLVTPERMSTLDLFRYIRHLRDNKQDTQRYEIAFWKKVIYPLTLFVMVALALPFAYLHARAGAVGVKVFGGIMLGLSFHLSNTLFSHVGLLHTWPPIISALVPGTLYLMVALLALRWVDRH
ncbi:LPS export ABC transporter permease LptG [Cupriavidus oxalaticus]|jgi:lipopolysaccharide export system permease protein|uniref:LPS export ABC transporter permease LptG n=1 Tax=Cupriavidus oxalaticus TaxID=96344 RepID=A0A375G4W1_9BURK|nr:LPS export ABC transporter permease LptG [Cupriavidus oxalaticus]QEZ47624.1 LPS export ABC transporter permease LptG [Cupriavidus oxalaticus]QRQ88061.1 LPS export ABC transporter permease LptG [Cupriavidus oxalaticus]QRQ93613.1 LPS export ABC transporter permease LptG [Cupriavidus oxalaticus]WQD82241.1 LPS export ABC transporter permease LptG [Cupriavidus oxalaticus]SPC14384.1 putative permease, YjgP/YjgQ family [Cupriavidus oxalaticus]